MLCKLLVSGMIILLAAPLAAGEVAVTVYNNDLGVVSETRELEFVKGIDRLAFRDVPVRIDPNSVRFEIVGDDKNVSILEQNYAYDLVSPQQLYNKYVDNEVQLIDEQGRLYAGTLLAYSGSAITLLEPGGKVKIVSMEQVTEVSFPMLPDGLITRPTLFWLYQSDHEGALDCRVGYQTGGLTWAAEYVGVLDKDETNLDLSGWSSINNTSGKTFNDAKLKLIAGDIHRAQKAAPRRGELAMMAAPGLAEGFEEKAFFEYHMYTLPRRATLADKEIKQISLFEPASAKVDKEFVYRPDHDAGNVNVQIKFRNSADDGLGMPLPAGRLRMFKADDDGALILLGEDWVKHTPRDEEVSVKVGVAFDVKGEQKMIERTRVSQKVEDRHWEIEVRNHKTEDITVSVEKRLWGFWEILESSHEYSQEDANNIRFELPVKAGESSVIKLAVRFTNR
ncbi:MAG: DUF4139 domain-containing protein [bacterium]|nr:DUF4139 domain-containing protein [bacterium]